MTTTEKFVDHACPACGSTAIRCVVKESRTNSRCCGDCEGRTYQRPVHVWEAAS